MTNRTVCLARLVGAVCVGWVALGGVRVQGQPGGSADKPAATQPEARPEGGERAVVKARLTARLEAARQNVARLEKLLERLESGEDPESVRRDGLGAMRERVREGRDRLRPEDGPPPGEGPPGGPGWWRRGPGPDADVPGGEGGRPPPPPPPPLDGRGGPREGGGGPDGAPPMLLDLIERRAPEFAQRLRDLRERDPRAFDRVMERARGRFREIAGERDEELQRLRIEELRLGFDTMLAMRTLREQAERDGLEAAEAKATIEQLRDLTGRTYDTRRAIHEREVQTLQARVDKLKAQLQEQSPTREAFVDSRVGEVLQAIKERRPPKPDGVMEPERGPGRR